MNKRRNNRNSKQQKRLTIPEIAVEIKSINHHGYGVSDILYKENRYTVFVPYTMPGDVVNIKCQSYLDKNIIYATVTDYLTKSDQHQEPVCQHYGKCGGCMLQHFGVKGELEHKLNILQIALKNQGINFDGQIQMHHQDSLNMRRRATFSFSKTKNSFKIGFKAHKESKIIKIDNCPLLTDDLNLLLKYVSDNLNQYLSKDIIGSVYLIATEIENNAEMTIIAGRDITIDERLNFTDFINNQPHITAIYWQHGNNLPDPVIVKQPAQAKYDNSVINLPARAFLQPSIWGENVIAELIYKYLQPYNKIVDLFSGWGSLSVRLLQDKKYITAIDAMPEPLQAYKRLAADIKRGEYLQTKTSDLENAPAVIADLTETQAIIIDPARDGGKTQAQQLQQDKLPNTEIIIMVSCNYITFSRDVAILQRLGWVVTEMHMINQFAYSNHMEQVAILRPAA